MNEQCELCRRIGQIRADESPYFVAELETGYVVIGDHQLFNGYSLLLFKEHVSALHSLPDDTLSAFLEEMSLLGKAVNHAFDPIKLNYELLGNSIDHLHWHIFPRHEDDPRAVGPVWVIDKSIRYADSARPSKNQRIELKQRLLSSLMVFASHKIVRTFETLDVGLDQSLKI